MPRKVQLLARILGSLLLQSCSTFSPPYAICLLSTLFFLLLFSRHATAAFQPFPATPCRDLAASQGSLASVRVQLPATAWAPELVLSLKISTMYCRTWIVFFWVSEHGNNQQCVRRGYFETVTSFHNVKYLRADLLVKSRSFHRCTIYLNKIKQNNIYLGT